MQIVSTVEEVRKQIKKWREEGLSVVLFRQWVIFMRDIKV